MGELVTSFDEDTSVVIETNIDALCMWLVKSPLDYGVMVASNLFGDIISDLAAQLVGGLGFSPSANLGDKYGVFEPTHGSAPKYEKLSPSIVNPIAMILSAAMLLRHSLGLEAEAAPAHGRPWSLPLTLPPLGAVFLRAPPAAPRNPPAPAPAAR